MPGRGVNGGASTSNGSDNKPKRLTKNQKRRLKKKRAKERARAEAAAGTKVKQEPGTEKGGSKLPSSSSSGAQVKEEAGVQIEYVSDNPLEAFLQQQRALVGDQGGTVKNEGGAGSDKAVAEGEGEGEGSGEGSGDGSGAEADAVASFAEEIGKVFARFSTAEELVGGGAGKNGASGGGGGGGDDDDEDSDDMAVDSDGDDDDEEDGEGAKPLSRRQRKKKHRLSVAQLKQLVRRPDVVEAHDVTSSDPRLLIFLKAYRNTVPVPRHWCMKRKYLQGKRGIEREPFTLPEFIADTGITKIRDARNEEEEKKTSKQRQRDKMQPKMGKINIDYQILHDAFFKFQTKPPMTRHGDLYYEGKEYELKLHHKTPGQLSEALKHALGMPEGAPPPWLINMQRYGPPPAYPHLKIAGLNAPIPEGASFGYHPGGWGMPPVDDQGRPLYGDVFGVGEEDEDEVIDRTRWGELEEEEEESESEEEESEVEDEADVDASGIETPMDGATTVASGLSTPATIDLRKGVRKGLETPETPQLYQVLQSKTTSVGSGTLMGSSHQYVVPGAAGDGSGTASVDLAQLDDAALQARFSAAAGGGDGTSSEVASESSRKRKRQEEKEAARATKRAREKFKF